MWRALSFLPGMVTLVGANPPATASSQENRIIRVSLRHVLAAVLPPRLYHWLLTRVAYRFAASAQTLRSSVIFPYPFGDRGHYVLVPKRFIRSAFALAEADAVAAEKDLRSWAHQSDLPAGTGLQVIVNYGKYQETPFLHVHVIMEEASYQPAGRAGLGKKAWFVDITDGSPGYGRRIVHYCPGHNGATVTDLHP